MNNRRIERVNTLILQTIYETILKDVDDPKLRAHVTILRVITSTDIRHAKVYISIMEDDPDEKAAIFKSLERAQNFIAVHAAKRLSRMKYFPELKFFLDDSIEQMIRVNKLIDDLK
ncbi:30S ribosome-binding factor RbfA [Chlamydiia bacterium]|jgi:ribosome-binding factor A|nr:30S ribosome-binding factor RbfA [Chlamydiia bacterium]